MTQRGGAYNRRPVPKDYDSDWLAQEHQLLQQSIGPFVARSVATSVTQLSTDRYLLVDASGGARTVTLLVPSQWPPFPLTIIKTDSSANAVTLSGTVDGVVNPTLPLQYAARTLFSDGTSLWDDAVPSSANLASLTVAAGQATIVQGNIKRGGLAQQTGVGAVGFNIFTPASNVAYDLLISIKDAADGSPPTNACLDNVRLLNIAGWAPVVVTSSAVAGALGARTYSNNVGVLKVVVAGAGTVYVDIADTKFYS